MKNKLVFKKFKIASLDLQKKLRGGNGDELTVVSCDPSCDPNYTDVLFTCPDDTDKTNPTDTQPPTMTCNAICLTNTNDTVNTCNQTCFTN